MKEYSKVRRFPRVQTPEADREAENENRTVQSDARDADINVILSRYEATGVVAELGRVDLEFRDVSEFTDYGDAMRELEAARFGFMKLDPRVREVFGNDVGEWLDCAHDEDKLLAKREKLTELGVWDGPPAPTPPEVPPAPPVTPAEPEAS